MIDLERERLISLREAALILPSRGGKRFSYGTLNRWANKGLRGRRLESWKVGGRLYTSVAALNRFVSWRAAETQQGEQSDELRRALYGKPR